MSRRATVAADAVEGADRRIDATGEVLEGHFVNLA